MLSSVLSFRRGCCYFRNLTLIICLKVAAWIVFDVLLWVILPQFLQKKVSLHCLGGVEFVDIYVNMFLTLPGLPVMDCCVL